MVENLQSYGVFSSKKVAKVMETIDRGLFVPDGTPAYDDSPMSIGYNATISAPHMHAMCLQLLEQNLQPDMHALDVGSGAYVLHYYVMTFECNSFMSSHYSWKSNSQYYGTLVHDYFALAMFHLQCSIEILKFSLLIVCQGRDI